MMTLFFFVSRFLNLFPKALLVYLANVTGSVFCYAFPFRKDVILGNLRLAFGSSWTEELYQAAVRENYRHYARVLLEILLSLSWSKERCRSEMGFIGFENFEPYVKEGKGGIVLTGHMGNWEYSILGASATGLPLDVVVKEIRVSFLEKFVRFLRRKTGARLLLETGTAKDILRAVSDGRFVAFILDQYMGAPIGLPVKFFGHTAGTAAALALISELRDVPIFPANNYRDEKGKIIMEVHPPLKFSGLSENKNERLHQKTQVFNDTLEGFIRERPTQWLWIHRRWKEFRGETRWPVGSVSTAILTLVFLMSCSSAKVVSDSPTGIALPPDATIQVPVIAGPAPEVLDEVPKPSPKPEVVKKEKKKKSEKMIDSVSTNTTVKGMTTVPPDRVPFEIGERIEINLRWTALSAGRAVMEVREGPSFNGRPTYHLWGNVLSSKLVDAIYHVDNTAESFIDKAGFMPYKFLLHMVESKQLKETRVSFDHANGKAFYWAKRISERWGPQDIDRQDTLVPQARDMWSALYYARALSYQLHKTQTFVVYENGQNWTISLTPVAMELIQSPVGAFHCFKIQVKVTLNNVLTPMGDTFMWLSDDSKKYLVKFDTKIKIGSMNGIITSIKEH